MLRLHSGGRGRAMSITMAGAFMLPGCANVWDQRADHEGIFITVDVRSAQAAMVRIENTSHHTICLDARSLSRLLITYDENFQRLPSPPPAIEPPFDSNRARHELPPGAVWETLVEIPESSPTGVVVRYVQYVYWRSDSELSDKSLFLGPLASGLVHVGR